MERITPAVEKLSQYISKLKKNVHINEIDTIWRDVKSHRANLSELHRQLDSLIKNVEKIDQINNDIAALQQYRSMLESYEHLGDIDGIWSDVESHKVDLSGLHSQLDDFIKTMNYETTKISNDIAALQQYRSMLESYEHLGNIDSIWSDVENHKIDLSGLHSQLDAFIKTMNSETTKINKDITALQQYRSLLESYEHLGDIDCIWSDVENHKIDLSGLHSQLDAFIKTMNSETTKINKDITALQQYRSMLESYEHLGDIDGIWSDVEGHKVDLSGLHSQLNAFIDETHNVTAAIIKRIEENEEQHKIRKLLVDKRMKIAYGIAGGSVVFSLSQLVLQLLGIL